MKDSGSQEMVASHLDHPQSAVRLAAATAVGQFGAIAGILPLAGRLTGEDDSSSVIAIVRAMDQILMAQPEDRDPGPYLRTAVVAVAEALGRNDDSAPDITILFFLEKHRDRESVPRLIAFLQRFVDEPRLVRSRRLSPLLQVRANEILISLTGAHISATKPETWQQFWEREGDDLQVLGSRPAPEPQPRAKAAQATSAGFFNIPVNGSRILFLIDISYSMDQLMPLTPPGRTVAGPVKREEKFVIARSELWKAIESLPEDRAFNVIAYDGRLHQWDKDLNPATPAAKQKFKSWLDGLRTGPGTNIYDALEQALATKTGIHGGRYGSGVDEIFMLSDGEPQAGAITDTATISEVIRETNKYSNIRINTIYLETQRRGPSRGKQLMQELARDSGGVFVHR
jgi:hypothetical protein